MDLDQSFHLQTLLDVYGSLLNENQRQVLTARCFDDESLSEIADSFGVSRQAILDAEKKAKEKLEGFEEKLGIVEVKNQILFLVNAFSKNLLSKTDFLKKLDDVIRGI